MTFGNVTVCDECWERRNPGREPVRLVDPKRDVCAFCEKWTESGIRVRMEVRRA